MSRRESILRHFIASTRGLAAIEFAIIMPVLLILFLSSIDAGRVVAIYMKVRSATYTLDTITNICGDVQNGGQCQTPITTTGMQQIVAAAATVLSPYSSAPAIITVSQLSINASGQAAVSWSYSLNGTALAPGTSVTLPATLATAIETSSTFPQYLIFGQVSYQYTPIFTYFVSSSITLSDSLYAAPRNATCIVYLSSC
jgi:Flp pilus assembly protein TadG